MPALHVVVCSDAAHTYGLVSYRIHVVPDPGVIHVIHYWNDTVGPYRPNPRKRL
jgi:hypothetical protein